MEEPVRNVTVTCTSEHAQVIRIKSQSLFPKLMDKTLKELIGIGKTKHNLVKEIINSHIEIQTKQFKDNKTSQLMKTSNPISYSLKEKPIQVAMKMSMRNSISPVRSRKTMEYRSHSTSTIPAIRIPKIQDSPVSSPKLPLNNCFETILENTNFTFSPRG